jgi:Tfp pilus assembly protein FimV
VPSPDPLDVAEGKLDLADLAHADGDEATARALAEAVLASTTDLATKARARELLEKI